MLRPVVRLGHIPHGLAELYRELFVRRPNAIMASYGIRRSVELDVLQCSAGGRCLLIDLGYVDPKSEAEFLLEVFLVQPNVALIPRLRLPDLLASGARYDRSLLGLAGKGFSWQNELLPAPVVYGEKRGVCGDLSAYLAANLRLRGKHAYVRVTPSETGYHATVNCEGRILDPSRALGM